MGLFERFKRKKDCEQNVAAEEGTVPITSESEAESETVTVQGEQEEKDIVSCETNLLSGLDKECTAYMEDLRAAELYLEQVKLAIDNRREMERRYYERQEEILTNAQDTEQEPEQPESLDASVEIFLSPTQMTAFLYCLEPVGEGQDIEKETIESALLDAGIIFGILPEIVEKVADNKEYNVIYPVARGKSPVRGEDGRIVDHFPRELSMELEEDERGTMDYKNIYIYHDVDKDAVICDLFYPGQGQDGCDVKGNIVSAAAGKMPDIPQGKNTVIDEEQGALLAGTDGSISFQKGKFRVEPQLQVPGNVDLSTGNIEFDGDVLIVGDVQKGYRVEAEGNIIVCGLVEGAELSAGEDIEIRKGMNGNGEGYLKAQGEVRARFLEHAVVSAAEDVSAATIINCKITCGGNIFAKKGKGIIIGGTLAAGCSIEARRIGNLSNAKTLLKIGHSMNTEEDIQILNSELKSAEEILNKINTNLNYFNRLPSIPENKKELYSKLMEQKALYTNMKKDLGTKLEIIENQAADYSKCHVRGDYVFSTTEISLNYAKLVIKDTVTRCNVYFSDERLIIGSF